MRSFTLGGESSPKSGRGRSVPMVGDVATALARLGQREHFTSDQDLVFAGVVGGHLDSNLVRTIYHQALEHAGLRRLRFFHDLRHTFGTRAVEKAESILELKEWMGHANVQTTMRYMHYKSKADAARRLSEANTSSAPRARGGGSPRPQYAVGRGIELIDAANAPKTAAMMGTDRGLDVLAYQAIHSLNQGSGHDQSLRVAAEQRARFRSSF